MKTLLFGLLFLATLAQAEELRRETPFAFEECDRSQFINLPKSLAYVTDIAQRIMRANPQVFRDDLAPENICIGIQFNDASGRAFANAGSRSFFVETGMLTLVQNDAQLAVVVAHELAHVSMRHFHGGFPVSSPEVTRAAAELQRLEPILFAKSGRTTEQNNQVQEQYRAQQQIIDNAIAERFGQNVVNNWVEAEADHVGAQFYLQAGFSADELGFRAQQVVIATRRGIDRSSVVPGMTTQERIREAYTACNVTDPASMSEPSRGTMRYPAECWSVWDLRHNLPATNSQFRTQMTDGTSVVTLPLAEDANLSAVQAEVNAYQRPESAKAKNKTSRSRMPASVKPEVKSKKKNSHQHDGCLY